MQEKNDVDSVISIFNDNISDVSKRAIGNTYVRVGSIKMCKDIFAFGNYRVVLVDEYEKEIRVLQEKLAKANEALFLNDDIIIDLRDRNNILSQNTKISKSYHDSMVTGYIFLGICIMIMFIIGLIIGKYILV